MTNKNINKGEIIFLNFVAIYGPKYKSAFATQELMELTESHWSDALKNIDLDIIKKTILRCRDTLEWPPSIAEFRKLCIPTWKDLNFPSPQRALQLLFCNDDRFPILKKMRKDLNLTQLRMAKQEVAQKIFNEAYEKSIGDEILSKWENNEQIEFEEPKRLTELL